jgi:hypothetical protein
MMLVFYYHWVKIRGEIPQPFILGTPKPPSLVVQVTLSAKPVIRGGPIIRKYRLTTDGLYEAD